MLRSDAIKQLLEQRSVPHLARLYKPGLEVQVNVGHHGGTRVEKEVDGRTWSVWSNSDQTMEWYPYRLPRDANTDACTDNDYRVTFDHMKYVDSIGITGWNYKDKCSEFFGFDFDSIDGHASGLSDIELKQVRDAAFNIPWVTVIRSTSGKGLHMYIHLDKPFPTKNHTEHAAVARALLGKMMAVTGYKFEAKVDVCGHIMWWWHRKMDNPNCLAMVKQGERFSSDLIPSNWKDHLSVVSGKSKKVKAKTAGGFDADDLLRQKTCYGLDEKHLSIIAHLDGTSSYWDADNHILVTHTHLLKEIHSNEGLKGLFDTVSTGKDCPHDINCFCFPLPDGAFSVYRFNKGIKEHDSWRQDGKGWTYTYYNRDPDILMVMGAYKGIKTEKRDFVFKNAFQAIDALIHFGVDLKIQPTMMNREVRVKEDRDGQLIVKIMAHPSEDDASKMSEWELTKDKYFTRIFAAPKKAEAETSQATYDDLVRHIVSKDGEEMGWMIRVNGSTWHNENLQHVRLCLKHKGLKQNEIDYALGWAVANPWRIVMRPFQDEYPGGRDWNFRAPQFNYELQPPDKILRHPTWDMVFDHLGEGLNDAVMADEWCQHNHIYSGADYLKLWVASMFQQPDQPTPYLFFYGDQNTGKSIFHEAISMLMTRGSIQGDKAMQSEGDFNGELFNAVLCYIEEVHLGRNKKAYARLKEWVTALNISIHIKGKTPFMLPNTTHWCQFANEQDACPVFTGDKRITYVYVGPLEKEIPKKVLLNKLKEEAADFLTQIVMRTEIPETNSRLNIPPLKTADMEQVQLSNENSLERFLREQCYYAPGELMLISEFFDEFRSWIRNTDPDEFMKWSSPNKVSREIALAYGKIFNRRFHKGRSTKHDSHHAYANLSMSPPKENGVPYVSDGQFLRPQNIDPNSF